MRTFVGLVRIPFMLVAALAVGMLSSTAQALQCAGPPRGVYPSDGAQVPRASYVWTLCSSELGCAPPQLAANGADVALVEVDRRNVVDLGDLAGELQLVRYRPSVELASTGQLNPPSGPGFRIVADDGAPRPPPRMTGLEFLSGGWSANGRLPTMARFVFEPDDRMLVADVGDANEDPVDSLAFHWVSHDDWYGDDDATGVRFYLGTSECWSNFSEAAVGVKTQVRFGFIDGVGRFSGWTSFYEIVFEDGSEGGWGPAPLPIEAPPAPGQASEPDPVSSAPEVESAAEPMTTGAVTGGCALAAMPGASAGPRWWLLGVVPLLARRGRQRRSR